MLRHDTTATLLLMMFHTVLVFETESVTVQPFHGEFLLCSRRLVWLELDLLTECCNLLIDWFAADTLVSRHTVTANMDVVNVHAACRTRHFKHRSSFFGWFGFALPCCRWRC